VCDLLMRIKFETTVMLRCQWQGAALAAVTCFLCQSWAESGLSVPFTTALKRVVAEGVEKQIQIRDCLKLAYTLTNTGWLH